MKLDYVLVSERVTSANRLHYHSVSESAMRILEEVCADAWLFINKNIKYRSPSYISSYLFPPILLLLSRPLILPLNPLSFFLAIEIRIYVEMYIIYFTESLFVFIVLYPFVPFLWLSIPYLFYLHFHSVRARILEFMMSTGVRPPPPINDFTLFTGHQLHNLSASISGQGLGSIFGLGSASKTLTSESPLKSSDQRWEQRICRY